MVTWPEMFVRSGFTVEQVARQDYLTGVPRADGKFFCKACGVMVAGGREKHFKQHVRELTAYTKQAEERKAQEKATQARKNFHGGSAKPKPVKSAFYDHTCACGAQIARTGKRGAPPKKCEACRTSVPSTVVVSTCAGKKADGGKCGMKALVGSTFCRWHQSSK